MESSSGVLSSGFSNKDISIEKYTLFQSPVRDKNLLARMNKWRLKLYYKESQSVSTPWTVIFFLYRQTYV